MPPFSSDYAASVLERVCVEVWEEHRGASLMRMGENAMFRLGGRSSAVVVRVARDLSRLEIASRELCMSRWLNGTGTVPAVEVYEVVTDQPRIVDGHPITFWRFVEPSAEAPTVQDLGHLLRSLHALTDSPCQLPEFDPLATVRPRLASGLPIPEPDHKFLLERCEVIDAMLPDVEFTLPPGPIHGDAHTGNLLGRAGQARLTDFEVSATGPREWDLVPLAVAVDRLGLSGQLWEQFVTAYGFDVRRWRDYPVFREARELGMTTWLAQNAGESEAIAKEVALRVRCLRDGDLRSGWTAF